MHYLILFVKNYSEQLFQKRTETLLNINLTVCEVF